MEYSNVRVKGGVSSPEEKGKFDCQERVGYSFCQEHASLLSSLGLAPLTSLHYIEQHQVAEGQLLLWTTDPAVFSYGSQKEDSEGKEGVEEGGKYIHLPWKMRSFGGELCLRAREDGNDGGFLSGGGFVIFFCGDPYVM